MGEEGNSAAVRLFSDVASTVSDPWLRRAFDLAERGRGLTAPNPVVGCVIVRDGEVVGEGFHERAGGPHAEVVALVEAGEAARGGTAYVTLEPCNHHGRTPPCTEALTAAGVARVVVGMGDPNRHVAGGGAGALREAGIDVVFADDAAPFVEQNEAWIAVNRGTVAHEADPRQKTGARPYVRVKLALTLDGHPALRPGERAAITGFHGSNITRVLRERADAVLVGAATVTADDPSLTVRDADGATASRQPVRVVLCGGSVPDATHAVFSDGVARTVVLAPGTLASTARAALPHRVEVAEYDSSEGLPSALRRLLEMGVVDLLIEPGPRLFSTLWASALIDELVTVHAGGMGGPDAPALFFGAPDLLAGVQALDHVMQPVEVGIIGDVSVTVWKCGASRAESDVETVSASSVVATPWR